MHWWRKQGTLVCQISMTRDSFKVDLHPNVFIVSIFLHNSCIFFRWECGFHVGGRCEAVVRPLWGCFDWRSILVGFNEKWGIKVRISWISFIETWLRNNFQLTWENKTDFPFLARKIEAGKALHYLSIIRHSTEVGFTHQTQPSWVRFLTSG